MPTDTTELEELIDSTITIGSIPACLAEVLGVIDDPEGCVGDLVSVIEKDPPIAAKVLRLANSPIYSLRQPVGAIGAACVVLGLKTIKSLIVQATVVDKLWLQPNVAGFDANWLWDHSVKSAVAARLLCRALPDAFFLDADEAYTSGLIHDVGKILLAQHAPQKFSKALMLSKEYDISLFRAEVQVFGFTDAHACALLANRWRFGVDTVMATMRHHDRETHPEAWARSRLVHLASSMAHDVTEGCYWIPEPADENALHEAGLDDDTHEEIRAQVRETSVDYV